MAKASIKNGILALAVVGMMGLSYSAGLAEGSDTLTRLNQTIDVLTKARALLNATPVRKGYSDVEAAKQSVDKAIESTQKAVVANGG